MAAGSAAIAVVAMPVKRTEEEEAVSVQTEVWTEEVTMLLLEHTSHFLNAVIEIRQSGTPPSHQHILW